jgi:hypothetical protein
LNYQGETAVLPDSTSEASSGPEGYVSDACQWPYFAHDTGVIEAWKLLYHLDKLSSGVKIAFLDMGFAPDQDFPDHITYKSVIPSVETDDVPGKPSLSMCTEKADYVGCWHGTHVVSAAMACPDNSFGAAGPAGLLVNEAVMIYTTSSALFSVPALDFALKQGAQIINMSYVASYIPSSMAYTIAPFTDATQAAADQDVLIFASAGNRDLDVNAKDHNQKELCFITPCENKGVRCVGALKENSQYKSELSNYGDEKVDIFAPGHVFVGPDPLVCSDETTSCNKAQKSNPQKGTSFSSAFASGVAALVWAANPDLSANQVWTIMKETAHISPDKRINGYINAYAAVLEAINAAIAYVEIQSPENNTTYGSDSPLTFKASIELVSNNIPLTVTWNSQKDGLLNEETFQNLEGLVSQESLFDHSLSPGSHTITVTASAGDSTEEKSIDITVEEIIINYYCDNDGDGYKSSTVTGTCNGQGCTPEGCQEEPGTDCDDSNAKSFPGNPEKCDGVDNDCDSLVDEDLAPRPTTCGLGQCARTGVETCSSGQWVDTCVPGQPSDEICDDLDNDCDGLVDEDLFCQTYRVEAFIDGISQLILQQNTAQWFHMVHAAPGRLDLMNEPTIINDIRWFPQWPDEPDAENRDCECNSDTFTDITPQLPYSEMTVELRIIQSRSETSIVQLPSFDNDFTLIIEFNDDPPSGGEWYIIEIDVAGEI